MTVLGIHSGKVFPVIFELFPVIANCFSLYFSLLLAFSGPETGLGQRSRKSSRLKDKHSGHTDLSS
jgi:hypothetical protein